MPCRSAELPDDHEAPPGMAFRTLRDLYGRVDEHLWTLAGRAAQLVEWDRTHLHCGRCGAPTEHAPGERARRCTVCGHAAFPRLSPAVIVRVTRGDEILLARAQRFPGRLYSVLAGFVEPGESLEECVARELEEEVGIEVADITYFASQPWPFPHSLMIGFTATWVSGDLRIEEAELRRRALVHARQPARSPRPAVDRPQADRRLAVARAASSCASWSATISPARMKPCGSISVIQARTAVSGTPSVLVTASWIAVRTARFSSSVRPGSMWIWIIGIAVLLGS